MAISSGTQTQDMRKAPKKTATLENVRKAREAADEILKNHRTH